MARTAADGFHPAAAFFYCAALLALAMLCFHPALIALGLAAAALQNLMLRARPFLRQLAWNLPVCAAFAAFNPLINHGGKTLLFYFWGSPVTREALLYGLCQGGSLLLVFWLFGVYNVLVPPDRFSYLFSPAAPAASMLVTMTQRMLPLFARRLREIEAVQRTLRPPAGREESGRRGALRRRLREVSILLSWSMEDGLDTADSMKARGYGLSRRTSFSVFRFARRDALALCFTLLCAAGCVFCFYRFARCRFFPRAAFSGALPAGLFYAALAAALPACRAVSALRWRAAARRMGRPEGSGALAQTGYSRTE